MSLSYREREVPNRIDAHIDHTRNIKNYLVQRCGRRGLRETRVSVLEYDLMTTRRKANDIKLEAEGVETRFVRLENRMAETESRLIDTQSELWEMKAALHAGQTAYDFEKDLAAYIYPPGTSVIHGKIFTTLMNWVRQNRETTEGRESNRKWEELKKQFGWSPGHKNIFFKMLRCRQTYAHPNVDFTFPIPGNFTRTEKRHAEDIRKMTFWLNEQHNP